MKLSSFWNTITNLGVDEAELGREVVKVRLESGGLLASYKSTIFLHSISYTKINVEMFEVV